MGEKKGAGEVQARLTALDAATKVGHYVKDETDVYAGRGDGGEAHLLNTAVGERGWLGNPFPSEECRSRVASIDRYREAFEARLEANEEFRAAVRALHGQVLGCFCQRLHEDSPRCHAEVIAEWADRLATE